MEKQERPLDRRSPSFWNLTIRYFIENNKAVGFIAGWSAYPIGAALLSILGIR